MHSHQTIGILGFVNMGDRPLCLTELLGITRDEPLWHLWRNQHELEKKEYSDVHFYSIRPKGISFQWTPQPDPSRSKLLAIDIYNGHQKWGPYPYYPIIIYHGEKYLEVQPTTKALEFVQALGEPKRKGGGALTAGPAMWMEWELLSAQPESMSRLFVQVEFAGESARSPDRWEPGRGTEAVWGIMTLSNAPP